ncbi:hypothetical protein [Actinomadura sp. K4S16]|uniref:hypothetical protein n=1 Tax=Actinomadura sp. K4S16 TaxID=1316147 RepID=UPI001357A0BA|nr:hypothetical protein [Actinomadura sp. K4S16]
MPTTDQEEREPPEIRREPEAREADREAGLIRTSLEAGQIPPGYEIYTGEQIASGEWLS